MFPIYGRMSCLGLRLPHIFSHAPEVCCHLAHVLLHAAQRALEVPPGPWLLTVSQGPLQISPLLKATHFKMARQMVLFLFKAHSGGIRTASGARVGLEACACFSFFSPGLLLLQWVYRPLTQPMALRLQLHIRQLGLHALLELLVQLLRCGLHGLRAEAEALRQWGQEPSGKKNPVVIDSLLKLPVGT